MINEMKLTLLHPLNEQMDEYHLYFSKFRDAEQKLLSDSTEVDYKEEIEQLKKLYKKPKGDLKKEFDSKINEVRIKYKKKLEDFIVSNDAYLEMKQKLANWNIYEIKKQMEKINKAKKIEDLGFNIDTAREFCNENGIEFRIELDKM